MKNLSTVEMYNPETNEWSFVAPMESHEGGVGVGVIPMEEWNILVLNHKTSLHLDGPKMYYIIVFKGR